MAISAGSKAYLDLEKELFGARFESGGDTAENAILEQMDRVWAELDEADRTWLRTRPPDTQGEGSAPWLDEDL